MNFRLFICASASSLVLAGLLSPGAFTANQPPLATWNIRPSGTASSTGELLFRVIPPDGSDPVEVTVSVLSGADEVAVARNIRRALGAQLRSDKFNVSMSEGANVVVRDPRGRANFSVELVTSDVDDLRVAVSATAPIASPTVPPQAIPDEPGHGTSAANTASARWGRGARSARRFRYRSHRPSYRSRRFPRRSHQHRCRRARSNHRIPERPRRHRRRPESGRHLTKRRNPLSRAGNEEARPGTGRDAPNLLTQSERPAQRAGRASDGVTHGVCIATRRMHGARAAHLHGECSTAARRQ